MSLPTEGSIVSTRTLGSFLTSSLGACAGGCHSETFNRPGKFCGLRIEFPINILTHSWMPSTIDG